MIRRGPIAALGAALLVTSGSAHAADTASTSATITVGVRSITVDKAAVTCTPALGFPNGWCHTDPVTITNGSAPSHVRTLAGPAFGSNGQPPNWTPCGAESVAQCTGGGNPGVDQYGAFIEDAAAPSNYQLIGDMFSPDYIFGVEGAARAGQTSVEAIRIEGPSSTTNPSPSFTTGITWMAAP